MPHACEKQLLTPRSLGARRAEDQDERDRAEQHEQEVEYVQRRHGVFLRSVLGPSLKRERDKVRSDEWGDCVALTLPYATHLVVISKTIIALTMTSSMCQTTGGHCFRSELSVSSRSCDVDGTAMVEHTGGAVREAAADRTHESQSSSTPLSPDSSTSSQSRTQRSIG